MYFIASLIFIGLFIVIWMLPNQQCQSTEGQRHLITSLVFKMFFYFTSSVEEADKE